MFQQKIILLNKVLFVIVIALVIYIGIGVILLFAPKEKYSLKISRQPKTFSIDKKEISPPQPLSYYEKVSSGKLFGSSIAPHPVPAPSLPKVETVPEEKPVVTPPEKEVTFKLIGITWGEKGANALIKSSQSAETQLLNIGDSISGYQVVSITNEAVILSKGNERKIVGLEE